MPGTRQWDGVARRWAVGLALLALFLQGVAPAGFMLAREDGRSTIVICTGHGAAHSLADLAGRPAKAPKSQPDAPCAFAGLGVATAAPIAALIAEPVAAPGAPAAELKIDVAPGRGLAAPPPPSQAPPQLTL